jgi:hypothetical protein
MAKEAFFLIPNLFQITQDATPAFGSAGHTLFKREARPRRQTSRRRQALIQLHARSPVDLRRLLSTVVVSIPGIGATIRRRGCLATLL